MNRIITILVTIFILLLLYIWISHVWGSEKPRHAKPISEVTENGISDDLTADADTTMLHPAQVADTSSAVSMNDDFETERKVSEPQKMVPEQKAEPKPSDEKKKAEPKAEVKKPTVQQTPQVSTTAKSNTTTAPAQTTKPVPQPAATHNNDGKHLVIAGNFSQLANAQQRVAELKKAGFPDAEVVNFDLSEYHTVCVGRFSDVNEARKLVKKLKDYHKIDAYVRIGS